METNAGNTKAGKSGKLSFLDKIKEEIESEKPQKPLDIELIENAERERELHGKKSKKYKKEHKNKQTNNDIADNLIPNSPEKSTSSRVQEKTDVTTKLSKAEQKRLESLKERHSARDNQKKLIKMAIKSSKPANNKIKFEQSDDETPHHEKPEEGNKRKLFDESEDSDSEISFNVSKTKSKFIKTKVSGVDERFRMDSKFFDEEDKEDEKEMEVDEEQDKLMSIANSIIGKEIRVKKVTKNEALPTRFDPMDKNHKSLIVQKEDDLQEEPVKKKEKMKKFKVTQDRFYDVSDNLKEQFKESKSNEFSLLGLFGGKVEEVKTEEKIKTKNIPLKTPLQSGVPNFFNINEESESEDDETTPKKQTNDSKSSLFEKLFINLDDPRAEEALDFFNSPLEMKLSHRAISKTLRKIVKKKHLNNITKSKQFKTKLGLRRKFNQKKSNKNASKGKN